jgi:MEMO1 family protein
MTTIRKPAMAGWFYPSDRKALQAQISRLLAEVRQAGLPPKALIVPHAGYIYSGPIAASGYATVAAVRDQIRRVVLLGPAHRVGFRGLAMPSARYFETPLGQVPLDRAALDSIASLPPVVTLDAAHVQEHSLEVHVPFLQMVLSNFALVPLVVGDAQPAAVGRVLEQLWGGDETLIVVSSDLSHYLDYDTARERDSATSAAIEQQRYEDIGYDDACGRVPVSGLLYEARRRGMSVRRIDLRNSGDTAGARDRVVGYGAYVVS